MNLFAKALSLLTFFKSRGREFKSFNEEEIALALDHCLQWFENVLNDDGLPASSYSLLLDQLNGPSAKTVAHWLEAFVLKSTINHPVLTKASAVKQHADLMAEWLISIQRNDGTWPVGSNDYKNRPPSVFQTGIIIGSLISYCEQSGAIPEITNAIDNGVHWLLKMQNENGSWEEYVFGKHLLCTNTGASLIRAGMFLGDSRILSQGKKAVDYYFTFQIGNGFFYFLPSGQKDYFSSDYGFILNGLSTAALLTGNRPYAEKVWHGLKPLIHSAKGHGIIPGIINYDFNAPVNYYSLYGSVMTILTALNIYPLIQLNEIDSAARSIARHVASAKLNSDNKLIHGSFSVSQPSSGGYKPYEISGDAMALFTKSLLMLLNPEYQPENHSNRGIAVNPEKNL